MSLVGRLEDELRAPVAIEPSDVEPHRARFALSYAVDDDGHWRWRRRINPKGYGCFSIYVAASAGETRGRRVTRYAHRVSWALHRGRVPAELQVEHGCRETDCVNPDHLELVTPTVNRARVGLPPTSGPSPFVGFGGVRRDDEVPL